MRMNHGISQGLVKLYRQKCNNTKKKCLLENTSQSNKEKEGEKSNSNCFILYIFRLRINGCGIFDVLSFDASNSPNAMIPHFQVNDLNFISSSSKNLTLF